VIRGRSPTLWKHYRDDFPNLARVDTVLAWLSRRDTLRPRMVTLYFSLVDHEAHDFGPWGARTRAAALTVDTAIGHLVGGLARAGLADKTNLVIISDHGMAATAPERVVMLDDYLPPASLEVVQLSPFFSAGAREGHLAGSLAALRRVPHFSVFLRDSTPERWHYRGNARIPPIVGVMDEGWELTARGRRPPRLGNHGFDNIQPGMRATFLAAGPAFRRGAILEPFQNIHVYSLLCAVLGVRPAPNDGTLDSLRAALRQPR
jgi:predicted AlkP superfamily pyrophosphatase or phosphodiesterase